MHIGIKSAWETMLERRSVLKTVLDAKSYREVNRIMFPEQPIEEETNDAPLNREEKLNY